MLRRSITGVAAVSVIALGAVACTSKSSTSSPSTSATTAASSSAATTPTAASSAPVVASGSASAGGPVNHGGVTLAQSAALSTTQGTKAITVENNPIPTLEDNFNAFDSNGFGYKLNIEGMFYEPLLMFNDLKANTAYPWLASDFSWNDDGTQITFTIRDGVKFSDGSCTHAGRRRVHVPGHEGRPGR